MATVIQTVKGFREGLMAGWTQVALMTVGHQAMGDVIDLFILLKFSSQIHSD
jgi:hypothetical protein